MNDAFTFKLEINFPISATMTPDDLTDKLRSLASEIDRRWGTVEGVEGDDIRDVWGERVGQWTFGRCDDERPEASDLFEQMAADMRRVTS